LGGLPGEPVGVALTGVDSDREWIGDGAPAGDPGAGVGCPDGLLRLPEDRFPALDLREDELGAGLPGTIEDEFDRRSPPPAQDHRGLLDDLGVRRPGVLQPVAVHTRGRRRAVTGLQRDPALERQPENVGQTAVLPAVPRDHEQNRPGLLAHATAA
jgi:hypothetical protein